MFFGPRGESHSTKQLVCIFNSDLLDITGAGMSYLVKAALIFLATVFAFGPIVRAMNMDEQIWVLAGLVGLFVLLYDTVEGRLRKKKNDDSEQ